MEYNAVNIALKGEKQGEYHMSTLGPYDYWAIEYGYREFAPEQEAAELARIASRSNEPQLAFMADDSLYYSGLDPLANTFDLGSDPLLYAERQLKLGRELWQLTESRPLQAGENYALLRRNFNRGLFEVQQSALQAVKYIGGLTLLLRSRRQRPHAARAGAGREAARRAQPPRRDGFRRRQLPLPAGVPEQARDQRSRHRRCQGARPQRADRRRRRRPAGARACSAPFSVRCSARRSRNGCSTTSSR